MIPAIRNLFHKQRSRQPDKPAAEAYDIWSGSYDSQPGNLMLDLDEVIFSGLISNVALKGKRIADIGCGTGRHWRKLYEKEPALVMGFDVSAGMLNQLSRKFPQASALQITDNRLTMVSDASVDCMVTTLTIAHIQDINDAIRAWARVLKPGGDLIITDFHPATLAKGGKRSFMHEGKTLVVTNYVHSLEEVKRTFCMHGLTVVTQVERHVDEEVRPYYAAQNALPVYDRFKGLPIIYGLHLKKQHAAD